MNLEPLGDRVIIQTEHAPEMTEGGIIVPDSVQEKPLQGTVVAVGPGKRDDNGKRIELDVFVGDTVLYAKYSGTDATIAGIEYLLLNEHDILARVKDEPSHAFEEASEDEKEEENAEPLHQS